MPKNSVTWNVDSKAEFSVLNDRIVIGRSLFPYLREEYVDRDDLNEYIDFARSTRFEKPDGINPLLKWLCAQTPPEEEYIQALDLKKIIYECDIVCARGVLTKLAMRRFTKKNRHFRIVALRVKGIVFIAEADFIENYRHKKSEVEGSKIGIFRSEAFTRFLVNERVEGSLNYCVTRIDIKTGENETMRILSSARVFGIDKNGYHAFLKLLPSVPLDHMVKNSILSAAFSATPNIFFGSSDPATDHIDAYHVTLTEVKKCPVINYKSQITLGMSHIQSMLKQICDRLTNDRTALVIDIDDEMEFTQQLFGPSNFLGEEFCRKFDIR